MELKEQVQERMADVEEQNNKLRRENDKLLVELHKKEEAEVDMIAAKMRLQAEEERLRQIVAAIEVEKQTATQRSRHS